MIFACIFLLKIFIVIIYTETISLTMDEGCVRFELRPLSGAFAKIFLFLITTLFFNARLLGDVSIYPKDRSTEVLKDKRAQYDFVIVGAGTAGCVLANRLAQKQDWKILLVEVGDYPTATTEVPALYQSLTYSAEDWTFILQTDNASLGMKRCKLSQGRVLGGTSTINNMHYARAMPSDIDMWNCVNWDYKTLSKVFENLEQYVGVNDEISYGLHGDIPLMNFKRDSYFLRDLLEKGYKHLGYHRIPRNKFIGYKDELVAVDGGRRQNNAKVFLGPVKDYTNLYFVKNCRVIDIMTHSPTDKRTSSVEMIIKGTSKTIRVKKEVILAAGVINTPKLLMLSGIGPKEELKKHKITLIEDLPVGKNLQIHVSVPIYVSLNCCSQCLLCCQQSVKKRVDDVYEYVMSHSGSLVSSGINDFSCYINTKKRDFPLPSVVDYHYYFKPSDPDLVEYLDRMEYKKEIRKSLLQFNKDKSILVFLVTLLNPLSVGEVLLNGTDYMKDPIVKPNFFSDEDNIDMLNMISGIKHVINMTESEHFVNLKASYLRIDIPKCRNLKSCINDYLKCYIRHMAYPSSNMAGTARMGRLCDERTVVLPDLEVKNVRGLRVVDASIMPKIISTAKEGTVTAIAEMASEFIKQKWIKDYPRLYKLDDQCDDVTPEPDDDDDDTDSY